MERAFSVDKRCYGMGCITTKLQETQLTSIALSVFVSNLFRMKRLILYTLLSVLKKEGIASNGTVQLLWVAPIVRYEMRDKVTE